jgi:hypothetical protein
MSDENERMNEEQRKTWGSYCRTLAVLREEYPDDKGISEMVEIVKTDPYRFLKEFPYKARAARAKGIGVPMSGVDWLPTANAPYINRQGYSHLLQKDERKIRSIRIWTKIYPFLVTPAEKDDKIIGASEDGTCVASCRIDFQNEEWYEEEGTANQKSVGSMVKERLVEMAHTRAFNRTAALATGKGLVSAEEMRDRLEPAVKAEDPETIGARERAKMALNTLTPAEQITVLVGTAKTVDPDTLTIQDADAVCRAAAIVVEKKKGETKNAEKETGGKTRKGRKSTKAVA